MPQWKAMANNTLYTVDWVIFAVLHKSNNLKIIYSPYQSSKNDQYGL